MKYSLLIIKFFIIINFTLGLFINVPSNSLVFLNKKANNLVLYNNKPNNINPDKNKSKIYKMNYNNDDLENYENDYNNSLLKIYIFLAIYYYVLFKILNINLF